MKMPKPVLDSAKRNYLEKSGDFQGMLREPKITPFFMAMRTQGYTPVGPVKGCIELRICPLCECRYAGLYRNESHYAWGCPECEEITILDSGQPRQ